MMPSVTSYGLDVLSSYSYYLSINIGSSCVMFDLALRPISILFVLNIMQSIKSRYFSEYYKI